MIRSKARSPKTQACLRAKRDLLSKEAFLRRYDRVRLGCFKVASGTAVRKEEEISSRNNSSLTPHLSPRRYTLNNDVWRRVQS